MGEAYDDFEKALVAAYVDASGPFEAITVVDSVTGLESTVMTALDQEEQVEEGIKSLIEGDNGVAAAIQTYVKSLLGEHKEDDH